VRAGGSNSSANGTEKHGIEHERRDKAQRRACCRKKEKEIGRRSRRGKKPRWGASVGASQGAFVTGYEQVGKTAWREVPKRGREKEAENH